MKKLLVHYMSNWIPEHSIDEYKISLSDKLDEYDHIFTVIDSPESRVECLNPVILDDDNEIKKITAYIKVKLNLIKKGDTKDETDNCNNNI